MKAEFLKTDLARATDSLNKVSVMLSTLELETSGQASVSNVSARQAAAAADQRPPDA